MKLARLYLKAYGPFRDCVIDLGGRNCDFHIIHGPNEAGKSTALRALAGFLFGIPERTPDAFLHDYPALRVGATLLLSDGTYLSAMRRKARRHTLFALDAASGTELTDRPLAEDRLQALLGGLDEPLFRSLFGLDLEGLQTGSAALLRGEGEVGQSLFQAAAGLANLQDLSARLEAEAELLFKPRGTAARLNSALREYDEWRRQLREATVRSTAWEGVERLLREAIESHEGGRQVLLDKRAEQRRLERIRASLPLVAEHATKRAELETLDDVPVLPPEATQQRIAAEELLRVAGEAERTARPEFADLEMKLSGLSVREALLTQARAIERLFHRIEAQRDARDHLPGLDARAELHCTRIEALLAEIDPGCPLDGAPALAPPATLKARVQALTEQHVRLAEQHEQAKARLLEERATLADLEERLRSARVPDRLEEVSARLSAAAGAADSQERLLNLGHEAAHLRATFEREAAALWDGPAAELIPLPLPLDATVADFITGFTELARDEGLLADQRQTLTRDLAARRGELRTLEAGGEVVTQPEVHKARQRRDDGWFRVVRAYVERSADAETLGREFDSAWSLPQAYEAAVREADRLADLLHADTQRATTYETTRQRILEMEDALGQLAPRDAELQARHAELEHRWAELIAPVRQARLSPAAMQQWLSRHALLTQKWSHLEMLERQRGELTSQVEREATSVDAALALLGLPAPVDGEPRARALARARDAFEHAHKVSAERAAIERQIGAARIRIDGLGRKLRASETKLAQWQTEWREAVAALRLPADSLPAETRVRLDQLTALQQSFDALSSTTRESQSVRADVARYEADVVALAGDVAEPAEGRDAESLAASLYAALAEAGAADATRKRLATDLDRARRALANALKDQQAADTRLSEMLVNAGCQDSSMLPGIEDKSRRKRGLQARLTEIETQIVQQNARPVADVANEVAGHDLDGVSRRIEALEDEIREQDAKVEAAHQERIASQQTFDAIDGAGRAAEAKQEIESLAARIGADARAYARARLAGKVLARVVQAYRERHQGPLLTRAAELFAKITLGSFSTLVTDYADDRQVLLGVRPDDARVGVPGMSRGTRDQLFLSLRLAAIEQSLAGRDPMPVIIDDLLVQFDDARAGAALRVLAGLSTKTQVLFFTHHAHLRGIAKDLLPGGSFAEHRLARPDATNESSR